MDGIPNISAGSPTSLAKARPAAGIARVKATARRASFDASKRSTRADAAPSLSQDGRRDQVDKTRVGSRSRRSEGSIRWALVNRVRNEIATGTYESDDKLDAAIDRLLLQI